MSGESRTLTEQYASALKDYIEKESESALKSAYTLGHLAMQEGLSVRDMAALYHQSLATILRQTQRAEENLYWMEAAAKFFSESLLPFEKGRDDFQGADTLRRLQESEKRVQDFLDHSTAIIFLKDLEGRYLLVNSRFEAIFHVKRDQIIGKTDYDFLPLETAESFRENDRKIIAQTGPVYTEEMAAFDDGIHTFILVMFALRDERGQPYAVGGFTTDITDRKRAEKEIQQLNQQLQHHTVQLEATNKELEAFSYSVSHDLRSPLRSIDGFSLALLEDYGDILDAQGKDYLNRVRAATQRMAQLIDDLLNLSRVTRAEMSREVVDMSAHAYSIAAELQKTEPERVVEFVIEEKVFASGDTRLLHVVLENLLGNAWKFTGKREQARIEFGCVQREEGAIYFVRDNGVGFDMTYADRLFGAFQRLHAMTEFSGTGIGLATVQRIIHRHGGQVWAEGAVEQGAAFYFTL